MGSKTILNVKCKAIFSILLEEKKKFFLRLQMIEEVSAPKEKGTSGFAVVKTTWSFD